MIQSMTGHGEASRLHNGCSYVLELRSLNNRYFKATIRVPEHLAYLEPDLESQLRSRLGRGSVTCALKVDNPSDEAAYDVNVGVLRRYLDQLDKVRALSPAGASAAVDLAAMLALPGVCQPRIASETDRAEHGRLVAALLDEAIARLVAARKAEGEVIHRDLQAQCDVIATRLEQIRARAPRVADEYRDKLLARVQALLAQSGVAVQSDDLIREVAIFAERCDIHEEIQRLGNHVAQFRALCDSDELAGRKLDFISQELLREANTIASKANDSELTRWVVEIKASIDRLKEQVQNVE